MRTRFLGLEASLEPSDEPPGFGLRQPSGAFPLTTEGCESGAQAPHSKRFAASMCPCRFIRNGTGNGSVFHSHLNAMSRQSYSDVWFVQIVRSWKNEMNEDTGKSDYNERKNTADRARVSPGQPARSVK